MEQSMREQTIHINLSEIASLEGNLILPPYAQGIVLFAHGSGSSRHSPRNQYIAQRLHGTYFATLLLDLLTSREEEIDERNRQYRFDITLLAQRLCAAIDWLNQQNETRRLNIGLFGASTGAAAALVAAAKRPSMVSAVVSRGGRPDLAGDYLSKVQAPTLLIVGENDPEVLDLNRSAMPKLKAIKALEIIPGASHLFEEPGTLKQAANLAENWFTQHLIESG